MKLYLGGGRNTQEIPEMKELITAILKKENVQNLLHIPFAGAGIRHRTSERCMPRNFQPFIENLWGGGINYFDGSYKEDIVAAPYEAIYLNGGKYRDFLWQNIQKDEVLEKVTKTPLIIGESSGSTIFWAYFLNEKKDWFVKGLGLVPHTLIIPHYSTNYNTPEFHKLFQKAQETYHCQILGIDETTFVEYGNGKFWDVLWTGKVYHL